MIEDTLIGTVEYEQANYPFHYSHGTLQLFPPTPEERSKQYDKLYESFSNLKDFVPKQEWIPHIVIPGKTNKGTPVLFGTIDFPSNDCGYPSYNVDFIYQYVEQPHHKILAVDHIYLTFQELDCFYLHSTIQPIRPNRRLRECKIQSKHRKPLASYRYQGIIVSLSIEAGTRCSYGAKTSIATEKQLIISTSKLVDYNIALQLIEHARLLFMFLTRRKNIVFQTIHAEKHRGPKKSQCFYDRGEFELFEGSPESNSSWERRIMPSRYFDHASVSQLLQNIADKQLYLEHLPDSLENRTNTVASIIVDFASFEREFKNSFSQLHMLRSKEFYDAQQTACQLLLDEGRKHTGKTKKYYSAFSNTLKNSDGSFEAKFQHALNHCGTSMTYFIQKQFGASSEYQSSGARLNSLRNAYAHGNLDIEVLPIMVSDLYLLKVLYYVLVLKRIGVREDVLADAVKVLF